MNIDLLKINQDVKDLCKKQSESQKELKRQENFRKDLISIVQAIVAGEETTRVHELVYETLGIKGRKIKYFKEFTCGGLYPFYENMYEIKLTKKNIEKVIAYINVNGFTC